MSTTKFEYITFGLGEYPTVASKYRKICEDFDKINSVFLKSKEQKDNIRVLTELKAEYESLHSADELEMTEEKEKEYWIKRLAKRGAVELLAQGKVSADVMFKMASLSSDDYVECVKETTKLSSYMNHVTQQAEKEVAPSDIVPNELMPK
jgi:hypothetical protein